MKRLLRIGTGSSSNKRKAVELGHFRPIQRRSSAGSCPLYPESTEAPVGPRTVAFARMLVIQAPELGARVMRNVLADYEWLAIKPMLPNKSRGVPRVNDRRVLNGIFWVLRSAHPGAIYPRRSVPAPLATIALFAAGGLVFGTAS